MKYTDWLTRHGWLAEHDARGWHVGHTTLGLFNEWGRGATVEEAVEQAWERLLLHGRDIERPNEKTKHPPVIAG